MTTDIDQRLKAARHKVYIVSKQAYSGLSSNETIVGVTTSTEDEGGDSHNSNTRAGMDVGLALFGTSQSYKNQLEEDFHHKLCVVETELKLIEIQHNLIMTSRSSTTDNTNGTNSDDGSSESDNIGSSENEGRFRTINDVALLQAHITFLQQCSKAHKLLDDVDALSLQTNFASSFSSGGERNTKHNDSHGSVAASPFSIMCSSTSDFVNFAFDSPESKKGEQSASPMVQAAQYINAADDILNKVTVDLNVQYSATVVAEEEKNKDNIMQSNTTQMIQMQAKMLKELRHQTRRKKMELRHRAIALVEGCIIVERGEDGSGKLIVRGSGTSGTSPKTAFTNNEKKTVAFADVEESPISTSTPTNNEMKTPSSPLSDAYQVLKVFSNESFGETLDGAMKRLSTKLMNALHSVLTDLEGEEGLNEELRYYKLIQNSSSNVRSSGYGYDDRRLDPTIKGPAVELQWSQIKINTNDKGSGSIDDDCATLGKITTSGEINLRSLAATTTASLVTFLETINFLPTFLSFVHQHMLLQRLDLSQMLGNHLFGTYPLSDTSKASGGSIVLNGNLVGAAAHAVEEGDEMPLMIMLINAMKKCCVSKESYHSLQSMKLCLLKGVSAFERNLVEMNLMGGTTMSTTTSVVSDNPLPSPTGLSDNNIKIISPLSELANSLGQAYIDGLRLHILNQGRSILLNNDYHNTVRVGVLIPEPSNPGTLASLGDDPLKTFAFPQCSISITCKILMDLCKETLDDATNHDITAPMLYRVSRELLDLFRAIVPTMHASEVATIPRTAAILHNDCVYFAHESSLLGAEFRSLYSGGESADSRTKLLGEVCSFMDQVPPFRSLATKSMGAMLNVQKAQLYKLGESDRDVCRNV